MKSSTTCPVCFVSVEKENIFYEDSENSTCNNLSSDSRESRGKRRLDAEKKQMDQILMFKFLSILEDSKLNALENITKDLEKIQGIKKQFEFTPEAGLGSKRKYISDFTEIDDAKTSKIQDNIDYLSKCFSGSPNLQKFNEELSRFNLTYNTRTLSSFLIGDPLSLGPKIISSIESDRNGVLFATAGVSKQINFFEMNNVFSNGPESFSKYPSMSINTGAKMSCLSWNKHIGNRLCSADYDGLINTLDSTMGKILHSWNEHEKRAWSVDTSPHNSDLAISGSDDYKIKIWDYKQKKSTTTIDLRANVCSVRFSSQNCNLMAAGSADHRVWLFDIRKPSNPIFSAKEHSKSVSYVRFLNSNNELISASTDSTLKVWDYNNDSYQILNSLSGHCNEKNFVGLSVSDKNLIANGSEDNCVYIYNQYGKCPVLKYKMTTHCPLTGRLMDDEQGSFISCVSWANRCDSDGNPVLLISNSTGHVSLISVVEEQ